MRVARASAVMQEIQAHAVEHRLVFHHHPVSAFRHQYQPQVRAVLRKIHDAAVGHHSLIGAPEAQYRTLQLAESVHQHGNLHGRHHLAVHGLHHLHALGHQFVGGVLRVVHEAEGEGEREDVTGERTGGSRRPTPQLASEEQDASRNGELQGHAFDQFGRRLLHFEHEAVDDSRKVVVCDESGDTDNQPETSGDQCDADTGSRRQDDVLAATTVAFKHRPDIVNILGVKDAGILYELREREFYKKPSAVKKEMKNKAKARNYWKKVKLLEEDSRNRGRKF